MKYKFTKEHRQKISKALKGRIPWNKGGRHKEETKEKIRATLTGRKRPPFSDEWRRNISKVRRGEKCYLWKGGISKENSLIRLGVEMKLWREAVFARDNYTCQICGDKRGGNLEAHHLKGFATYPKLRFVIDNGQALCIKCHIKIDKFRGHRVN